MSNYFPTKLTEFSGRKDMALLLDGNTLRSVGQSFAIFKNITPIEKRFG